MSLIIYELLACCCYSPARNRAGRAERVCVSPMCETVGSHSGVLIQLYERQAGCEHLSKPHNEGWWSRHPDHPGLFTHHYTHKA